MTQETTISMDPNGDHGPNGTTAGFFLFGKGRPGDAPSDPRPDRPGKNLRSPTGKTRLQTEEFAIENGLWPM